ncbi:hypothetical protein Y1Q_0015604 [Alligator mississippiensis]|uniref:Uncharacterized protein n=1 Tax=Alligator mississippiensis TaxID=8496 RepID=A0A151NPF3_ALLMI|nr:hypothetical protein Y1Q_0015604 [Alligator mississippiensis]
MQPSRSREQVALEPLLPPGQLGTMTVAGESQYDFVLPYKGIVKHKEHGQRWVTSGRLRAEPSRSAEEAGWRLKLKDVPQQRRCGFSPRSLLHWKGFGVQFLEHAWYMELSADITSLKAAQKPSKDRAVLHSVYLTS